MAQERLFVLENGEITLIRDGLGNEVAFDTLEEFTKYTGDDLTGKYYIGYEPAINFYQDSEDPSVSAADMPVARFEDHMNNVVTYKDRKDDPFYGQTLEQAKETKRSQIIALEEEKGTEPIEFEGNYFKNTDAVSNTIKACELEGQAGGDSIYVNNGYWDTIDGIAVPFTVDKLIQLYKVGYDKQAANYANMKIHIANILSLTSVEDIKDYDITGGW